MRLVLLAGVLSLGSLACTSPSTPCSGAACGSSDDAGAQGAPDAGGTPDAGPMMTSAEQLCAHLVACGSQSSFETCIADVDRANAPYASCEGFAVAYAALVRCQDAAACDATGACDAAQQTVNDVILACVTPPAVDEDIARICARYNACIGEDQTCSFQYEERLVPAGPSCTAAHDALDAVATCLEGVMCDAFADCDAAWTTFYDAVFICSAGPPPEGEPFAEPRAYIHELVPAEQCMPENGNCNQSADFCPDGRANYVVTDIVLQGLYGVSNGVLRLSLAETGGETRDLVVFSVESNGDRLVRDDGAVFVRQMEPPFCGQ